MCIHKEMKRKTPDEMSWEEFKAMAEGELSYSYHDHQSPLCWMRPRFPIPEEIRKEMATWLQRAHEKDETRKS